MELEKGPSGRERLATALAATSIGLSLSGLAGSVAIASDGFAQVTGGLAQSAEATPQQVSSYRSQQSTWEIARDVAGAATILSLIATASAITVAIRKADRNKD